ncbi:hypothetical protein KP509_03G024000 [Ceratopteris richardii]|uniref:Uncharacterized protein n=1 Tax=Ceratopteris richardii TaxID=49495 RepID=A0A8T2V281_CERRI|nr:hypothetical protein KP509_03G024000 [Ceratopteris richardii]
MFCFWEVSLDGKESDHAEAKVHRPRREELKSYARRKAVLGRRGIQAIGASGTRREIYRVQKQATRKKVDSSRLDGAIRVGSSCCVFSILLTITDQTECISRVLLSHAGYSFQIS